MRDKEKQKITSRRHYEKHKDAYRARARKRKDVARKYVMDYKKSDDVSCVDCGESRWECLEFHHKDQTEKTNEVSKMIKNRCCIETIQKEMDKCDILCCNCHRVRHNGCKWNKDSSL